MSIKNIVVVVVGGGGGGGGLSKIHTHVDQEIHHYGIKRSLSPLVYILNQSFFSISMNTGLSLYSLPL